MVRRIVPTSVDERQTTLRALEATPTTLPALLRNVTVAQVQIQGQAPDSWAIVEVVSHPIDGEHRTFERTRRMVDETNPFLPVYPDDDCSKLPLGELIESSVFCGPPTPSFCEESASRTGPTPAGTNSTETSASGSWCARPSATTRSTWRRSLENLFQETRRSYSFRSATVAPLIRTRSAGAIGKTWWGVPAAAHTVSYWSRSRSR